MYYRMEKPTNINSDGIMLGALLISGALMLAGLTYSSTQGKVKPAPHKIKPIVYISEPNPTPAENYPYRNTEYDRITGRLVNIIERVEKE